MPVTEAPVLDGLEHAFRKPNFTVRHEAFVIGALLEFGRTLSKGESRLSPIPEADHLVRINPFAFLVAILLDQGVPAERAFNAPKVLEDRVGSLTAERVAGNPKALRAAMRQRPMPHRYPKVGADWIVKAATRVVTHYAGDAANIWAGAPTARELQNRFLEFDGVGQKKAAMAVEILERDLGVEVRELSGSDVAVDVHIRRVFQRTGLTAGASNEEIIETARAGHPTRPGELDVPAWIIGRTWCRPQKPKCAPCALNWACPTAPLPASPAQAPQIKSSEIGPPGPRRAFDSPRNPHTKRWIDGMNGSPLGTIETHLRSGTGLLKST